MGGHIGRATAHRGDSKMSSRQRMCKEYKRAVNKGGGFHEANKNRHMYTGK